jgi:hypothetical protein
VNDFAEPNKSRLEPCHVNKDLDELGHWFEMVMFRPGWLFTRTMDLY